MTSTTKHQRTLMWIQCFFSPKLITKMGKIQTDNSESQHFCVNGLWWPTCSLQLLSGVREGGGCDSWRGTEETSCEYVSNQNSCDTAKTFSPGSNCVCSLFAALLVMFFLESLSAAASCSQTNKELKLNITAHKEELHIQMINLRRIASAKCSIIFTVFLSIVLR